MSEAGIVYQTSLLVRCRGLSKWVFTIGVKHKTLTLVSLALLVRPTPHYHLEVSHPRVRAHPAKSPQVKIFELRCAASMFNDSSILSQFCLSSPAVSTNDRLVGRMCFAHTD